MKRIILVTAFSLFLPGCRDLFEKDIQDRTVEVVSPRNGVTAPEGEVTFLWKPVPSGEYYHLTIVSPSFANAAVVMADTLMPDTMLLTSYSFRQLLPPGDYQWNIRARNSAYVTRDNILTLTVEGEAPGEPEGNGNEDE